MNQRQVRLGALEEAKRNSGAHRTHRVTASGGHVRVQAGDAGPAGQMSATRTPPESSAPGTQRPSGAPGAFLLQGQVNRSDTE